MKLSKVVVADYYTEIRSLWEELEALSDYPAITQINTEVKAYIDDVHKEEEE